MTAIHGQIVPCASPTNNRRIQNNIQCIFALIGINIVITLDAIIAPPNMNLAPNRPAKYPAGICVMI